MQHAVVRLSSRALPRYMCAVRSSSPFVLSLAWLIALVIVGACGPPSSVTLLSADGTPSAIEGLRAPEDREFAPVLVRSHPSGFVVAGVTRARVGLCVGVLCTDDIALLVLGSYTTDGALRWTFSTGHADAPALVFIRDVATLPDGTTVIIAHASRTRNLATIAGEEIALPAGHFLLTIDDDGAGIAVRALPELDADDIFFESVFVAPLEDGVLLLQPNTLAQRTELVMLDVLGNELSRATLDGRSVEDVDARADGALVLLSRGETLERQPDDEERRQTMRVDVVLDGTLQNIVGDTVVDALAQQRPTFALVEDGGMVLGDVAGPSLDGLSVERRARDQSLLWRVEFPGELGAGDLVVFGDEVIVAGPFFNGDIVEDGDPEIDGTVLGRDEADNEYALVLSLATGDVIRAMSAPVREGDDDTFESSTSHAAAVDERVVVLGTYR